MSEGEVITYQDEDSSAGAYFGTYHSDDKTVKKVIIGAGVTKIPEFAFYRCSNLAEVDLGSCKEIGDGAFKQTALREVFIPKSTEKIGRLGSDAGVFAYCSKLQKVVFEGNNVKIIGACTFWGSSAEAIELKEGVTTIGRYAFADCFNLSTLVWPTSITTVEGGVFDRCAKLHELAGSKEQDDVITYLKSFITPLMKLCINNGELEEIKQALEEDTDAAKKSNAIGRTALFYLCENPTSTFAMIKCVATANPDPSQLSDSKAPKSKFVADMLNHLTTDEMRACPDTEEGIRAAIDEKKTLQTNNSTAMSNIVDQEARAKTTELQRRMVAQLQEGKANATQATFEELRDFSIKQADRLRDLIDVVMNKYRTTDPGRYKALETIPKSSPGQQQRPAPASLSVEDQVKFQIAAASWEEKDFREKMSELVNFFNGSEMTCEQVCEHYGLENSDGRWSKEFRTAAYKLEANTSDVVKARFGPPKGFPRALVKTKEGLEEEAKTGKKHNGLRDLNRITFEFEDPLLMALLFEVLNTIFKVVGLKNKYLQETFKQPPDLHLNLDLGNGWLVEVQMLFRDILAIKKEDHKFYDAKRASSPWDVPDRLFKGLSDPVDALRAKLEELRHLEKVGEKVAADERVKELQAENTRLLKLEELRHLEKVGDKVAADERVKKLEATNAEVMEENARLREPLRVATSATGVSTPPPPAPGAPRRFFLNRESRKSGVGKR